jgi:hypothetical protein
MDHARLLAPRQERSVERATGFDHRFQTFFDELGIIRRHARCDQPYPATRRHLAGAIVSAER